MENLEARILECMKQAGKPMKPGEIATVLGIDSDEISKVIKKLKDEEKIISPKRCFYSLPE